MIWVVMLPREPHCPRQVRGGLLLVTWQLDETVDDGISLFLVRDAVCAQSQGHQCHDSDLTRIRLRGGHSNLGPRIDVDPTVRSTCDRAANGVCDTDT